VVSVVQKLSTVEEYAKTRVAGFEEDIIETAATTPKNCPGF
jgi:hypothetical protein